MKKINLSCKGDNVWQIDFDDEDRARDFIWSLVGKVWGYYNEAYGEDDDLVFDTEDDCITWSEDGKRKYIAGWHWMEEQSLEPIKTEAGVPFYDLFMKLEG